MECWIYSLLQGVSQWAGLSRAGDVMCSRVNLWCWFDGKNISAKNYVRVNSLRLEDFEPISGAFRNSHFQAKIYPILSKITQYESGEKKREKKRDSPRSVMDKMLDCNLEVNKFGLPSRNYTCFRTLPFGTVGTLYSLQQWVKWYHCCSLTRMSSGLSIPQSLICH